MSRSRGRNGRRQQNFYQPRPYEQPGPQPNSAIIRGDVIDLGEVADGERDQVVASFSYYGVKIRVNPALTEIAVMDFFEAAEKVGARDPHAMVLVKQFARDSIHPADFETFWNVVKSKGVDTNGIMTLLYKILEGVTARPTGRPSDSSAGPTETSSASPVTSSLPDATQSRREAFLAQVRRFEAMGTGNGAAMAAQIVEIAKHQGIDLESDLIREPVRLGSLSG
jgi:hypothetical protein